MAFLGSGAENEIVLHGSNGREDNSVSNLSWGTHRQNSLDKVRDKTMYAGRAHWKNKLTELEVEIIFNFYLAGYSKRLIADRLSITHQNVHAVLIAKTWKHVYAKKMQISISEVYDMWSEGQKIASIKSLGHFKSKWNGRKI